MDAILSSNVLFQFLAGTAALLAFLIQFKWSDKRTNKFKYLRNTLAFTSLALCGVGVWVTIEDNREKKDGKRELQISFDSIQNNFDSVKVALQRSIYLSSRLDSQFLPFVALAVKRYPKLDTTTALTKLHYDYLVAGDVVISNNQKGGVTAHTNTGIINQGGAGNVYNQQINPEIPQRHFTISDAEWFKKNLPKKSTAFTITVYNNDVESVKYANEIAEYFKSKGLIMMMSPVGQIHGDYPKDKIGKSETSLSSDSTWFSITIFPLY